jgi:hypothetical protein
MKEAIAFTLCTTLVIWLNEWIPVGMSPDLDFAMLKVPTPPAVELVLNINKGAKVQDTPFVTRLLC